MPKRCFLFCSIPFLPGSNLLSFNFLAITLLTNSLLTFTFAVPLSALADDGKDQNTGGNNVYRGLSGQRVPAAGYALPVFNGLPATNMDSFVFQAGAMADQIYGDESIQGQPEFNGYTANHRINAGITGVNSAGLTTGHGSYMPSASGSDEFLASPGEWCQSGTSGYDIPAAPSLGSFIGKTVNSVFAELPGAMGSMGSSDASGLGRVMGMPNASISPFLPGAPGLPGLPGLPSPMTPPAISMTVPMPMSVPMSMPMPMPVPSGLPGLPGLPRISSTGQAFSPVPSLPNPFNGMGGGGQLAFGVPGF
jgi:hypothetical protein